MLAADVDVVAGVSGFEYAVCGESVCVAGVGAFVGLGVDGLAAHGRLVSSSAEPDQAEGVESAGRDAGEVAGDDRDAAEDDGVGGGVVGACPVADGGHGAFGLTSSPP